MFPIATRALKCRFTTRSTHIQSILRSQLVSRRRTLTTTITSCYPRNVLARRSLQNLKEPDDYTDTDTETFDESEVGAELGDTIGIIPPDYLQSRREKYSPTGEQRQKYSTLAASLEMSEISHFTFSDLLFLFEHHEFGSLSPTAVKNLYKALLHQSSFVLELEQYNQFFTHLYGPYLQISLDDGHLPIPSEAISLASSWIEDMKTLELEIDDTALSWFLLTAEGKGPEEVLKVWRKSQNLGLTPTAEGWNVLIRMHLGDAVHTHESVRSIWSKMKISGTTPNLRTCEATLHVAVKQKSSKAFDEILHTIQRSPLAWRQQGWASALGILDGPVQSSISESTSPAAQPKPKNRIFYTDLLHFYASISKAIHILRLIPIFKTFTDPPPNLDDLRVFLTVCTFKFPPTSIPGIDESVTAYEKYVGKSILKSVIAPWVADLIRDGKVQKQFWDEVVGVLVCGKVEGVEIGDLVEVWEGCEEFVPSLETLKGVAGLLGREKDVEKAEKFFTERVLVASVLEAYNREGALDGVYEALVEAWIGNGEEGLEVMAGMVADVREVEASRRRDLR